MAYREVWRALTGLTGASGLGWRFTSEAARARSIAWLVARFKLAPVRCGVPANPQEPFSKTRMPTPALSERLIEETRPSSATRLSWRRCS